MAYYYESADAANRDADIKRAADFLRLSVRLPEFAARFQRFTAGDPGLASAAVAYIAKVNGVSPVGGQQRPGAITKSAAQHCPACGHKIKSKHPACRHCGAERKAYIVTRKPKKGTTMSKRKKAAKKSQRAVILKAYQQASGVATTNRGEAIRAMMGAALRGYDPAERAAAERYFKHG